jgi:hypothetical protein
MAIIRSLTNFVDVLGLFYEEVEVTRYIALAESAGGFTIPDPASHISDRHIQDISAPGLLNAAQAVIFFRTTHTDSPSMSVRLNSTPLTHHTFADSGPHSWHEIIPPGALRPEFNELTFAASGDGSVTFSDVVILYTSTQLTVRKQRDRVASQ